jgi:hypothetical protein
MCVFLGESVEAHCSDSTPVPACRSLEETNVIPERE